MLPVALSLLFACGEPPAELPLRLDGPARVRVDQLGPVRGPRVVREDGSDPPSITWEVADPDVARVQDGVVVAEAPGETRVIAHAGDQELSWTLVVDPAMVLRIQGAPSVLSVGDTLQLRATATIGERSVSPGAVSWSSSDDELLVIDADGGATALAIGRVWITARGNGGASSMIEIDIR